MARPQTITILTIDLASTLPFYLTALEPLNYTLHSSSPLSSVLMVPTPPTNPDAPTAPTLILTQSASQALKTPPTTLLLPAPTRAAVRAFYAAAVDAGGRATAAPRYASDDASAAFAAVVRDPEGNELDVAWGGCEARGGGDAVSRSGAPRSLRGEGRRRKSASEAVPPSLPAGVGREDLGLVVGVVRGLAGPLMREVRRVDGLISEKAMIGTVIGAAAGAALAYAMCKSEEESGKAEIAFARAMAARESRRESKRASVSERVESVVSNKSKQRRGSAPIMEEPLADLSPPQPPLPPPPPSRSYGLPSYESVVREEQQMREEPRSRFSVSRSKTWPAELPPDDYYYYSRKSSTPRSNKARSTRSRRNSRDERFEKSALTMPKVPESYYVEGLEDSRTVLPSDSVSCAGSRKRNSRSAKYRRYSSYEIPERSYWFGEARSDARLGFSLPFRERSGDFRRRAFAGYAW